MPSESIFTFNLNGSMDFHGNSYGGHPTLSWAFSDNTFFIEGHYRYGLMELKLDKLMNKLSGESTMEDNLISSVSAEIIKPLNDKLFYDSFKLVLNRNWKIHILSSFGALYCRFEDQKFRIYDMFGMKKLYKEINGGIQEDDDFDELKYLEYLYILEGQSVLLYEKDSFKKIGTLYFNDCGVINGTFLNPLSKRKVFLKIDQISGDELLNDFKDLSESLRYFK